MAPSSESPPIRFGERFAFARWWQSLVILDENDTQFAKAIGRSATVVGDYRTAEKTPNSGIWTDAAERLGVDFDWLTGRQPEPPRGWPDRELFVALFRRWLATARRPHADEESYSPPAMVKGGSVADLVAKQKKAAAKKPRRRA